MRFSNFAQANQLMGQPSDGIGFAAARRMLEKVAFASPVLSNIDQ